MKLVESTLSLKDLYSIMYKRKKGMLLKLHIYQHNVFLVTLFAKLHIFKKAHTQNSELLCIVVILCIKQYGFFSIVKVFMVLVRQFNVSM